jgi:hypothetical protein
MIYDFGKLTDLSVQNLKPKNLKKMAFQSFKKPPVLVSVPDWIIQIFFRIDSKIHIFGFFFLILSG